MKSGLPVLANINPGNDLAAMIRQENVGRVSEDGTADTLVHQSLDLIKAIDADHGMKNRCKALYANLFSPETAVTQIVSAFGKK